MAEWLTFMAAPAAICVILAGIHCYLGLHVLARGVIFVDLSLAQVAALGMTVALGLGLDEHGPGSYLFSLGASLLAAGLFAIARQVEAKISQEAIIGIVYAFGSAAVVLLAQTLPHGAEHLKQLLVGQLLWATWPEVWSTALVYGLVALVHWLWRGPLMAASFSRGGGSHGAWDFLFYALFGVIITSSVRIVGVLQVFVYLIVPSLMASVVAKGIARRLAIGWTFSVLLSIGGMGLSYALDLPTGALIVVLFAGTAIAMMLVLAAARWLQRKRNQHGTHRLH